MPVEPTTPSPLRAKLLEMLGNLPVWAQVIVVAALVALAVARQAATPTPAPAPTVHVTLPTAPVAVGETGDVEARAPLRRAFGAMFRAQAMREFEKYGTKRIGGDEGPMSRERARQLAAQLDDESVHAAAHQTGALGDGTILRSLRDVLRWAIDHVDEFLALLKLLLPLLLAF